MEGIKKVANSYQFHAVSPRVEYIYTRTYACVICAC